MVGRVFGRLTVIASAPHPKWECLCECGTRRFIGGASLRRKTGAVRSCGCLVKEIAAELAVSRTKHGHSSGGKTTPEYKSWWSMRQRCENPAHKSWSHYGGAGIKISPKWLGESGFESFLRDMGPRPPGTSLDRIDPASDYGPGLCRWSTAKEQANNRRPRKVAVV